MTLSCLPVHKGFSGFSRRSGRCDVSGVGDESCSVWAQRFEFFYSRFVPDFAPDSRSHSIPICTDRPVKAKTEPSAQVSLNQWALRERSAGEASRKQKGHLLRWPFCLFSLCRCGKDCSQLRALCSPAHQSKPKRAFYPPSTVRMQDAQNGISARPQGARRLKRVPFSPAPPRAAWTAPSPGVRCREAGD